MQIDEESGLDEDQLFNQCAECSVELANQIADQHQDADVWDIADGVLAGAIHFWLFSRQPCDDTRCEGCTDVATAEKRMEMLRHIITETAQSSEYYHGTNDHNVGHA